MFMLGDMRCFVWTAEPRKHHTMTLAGAGDQRHGE